MQLRFSRLIRTLLIAMPALAWGAGTIAVTPANEAVLVGSTRQFTAAVSGLMNTAVTWSVNGMPGGSPAVGTITPAGAFTAPSMPMQVTITATSVADGTVKGNAIANVKMAGPSLASVTPTSMPTGSFTITLNGTGFVNGAAAYLNGAPLVTSFISGSQLKAAGVASVVGKNYIVVANPGSMGSNYLVVMVYSAGGGGSGPTLAVSPASALVVVNAVKQFNANFNGPVQAVTWSVVGGGTINAAGLYTAPAQVPAAATATVVATTSTNATASAAITIISNQPPTISSATPAPVPVGIFNLTINGAGFIPSSTATFGGAALSLQYVSPMQLVATGFTKANGQTPIVVSNGPINSLAFNVQIGVVNPLVTISSAQRFLQQAAFGPTTAETAHVMQVGHQGYLTEQFAMAGVSTLRMPNNSYVNSLPARFMTNVVMNPDQLRQRVAWALSQIVVVSRNKLIWNTTVGPYEEMLMADSFTNYRKILNDVTLSPAMGYFLDMANNGKGNAAGTILPNENYAREVMQLFSIGTVMLNPDGTPMLDGQGNEIPTYNQATIAEFARVFTGWTNAPAIAGGPVVWGSYMNPNAPLVAYPQQHDVGAKKLLNGAILPAGQTIQKDLADGLDNIFNHQNVGPFIGKQLIQFLVKSNPTPAYVSRVTAKFNNNGQGVRGDMKAVITQVLLDPEARQNDVAGLEQPSDGHLQEPALYTAGFLRALGGYVDDTNYFSWELFNMSQDIYQAPSVFNYYQPGYQVPGTGIMGGEFQIYTPYTAIYRANFGGGMFSQYSNPIQSYGPGTTVDLTPYVSLASVPASLVDALDMALMRGSMPAQMKQIITTAVQNEAGGNLRRVETGIYLIITSGLYNVWF